MYTVVGDLHMKHNNLKEITQLFGWLEELGNDVIILGDIFDGKEIIKGRCLNTLQKLIIASRLNFYLMVGNHDLFHVKSNESALETFKVLSNVTIVDTLMHIPGEQHDGYDLVLMPYMQDIEKTREILKTIPSNSILFGHQDVVGFEYSRSCTCQQGLTIEDYKDFHVVVMGHFHSYQKKKNIIYLGTPFTHQFGEGTTDKYIGLLDEKTGYIELLPTPFRKHLTLEVDCDILFKDGDESKIELEAGNYYRIILTGSLMNVKRFKKISSPNIKYVERPEIIREKSKISELDSPEKQFIYWGKKIKNLDNEAIKEAVELLREVK